MKNFERFLILFSNGRIRVLFHFSFYKFVILLLSFNYKLVHSINSNITQEKIAEKLKEDEIYPHIVNKLPSEIIEISYSGRFIRFGELLSKNNSFTKQQPTKVSWTADRKELYLILMTDPDGPTWNRPRENEWHHWLVANIHENDIEEAEVLSEYIGPLPKQGNRLHRYIFMIFQQPSVGDLAFTELNLDTRPVNRLRGYFSTQKFCKKYNLTLKAINYFKINWGPEIPGVAQPKPQKPKKMAENVTADPLILTMIPFV